MDELPELLQKGGWFGAKWFNPLRFVEKDYVLGEPKQLKLRIAEKVQELGGDWGLQLDQEKVTLLVQCRCFGLYFSPVNFYFCYDQKGQCKYMLAEVSNTPWNKRHFYLVDMKVQADSQKAFHVSPFMAMDMRYHWQVKPPEQSVAVKIENYQQQKVFCAAMALKKQAFDSKHLAKTLMSQPMMTAKIVLGIYFQALKLFIKRVPFIGHPEQSQ